MDFISPDYRQLNADLHRKNASYGAGSYRWSETVLALREELEAYTVLDYGMGKGLLKVSLGNPDWMSEYDPAIEGKDGEPEAADLVVCTDVLEHVEREHLEGVLGHLWKLSKRGLFLVIATRPSTKTLGDGRNAHLIVEDAAWWKAQLERFFHLASWSADGGEIVAVAKRLHQVGDIRVISAVSETVRFENARVNSAKSDKRLKIQPRHEGRVVIACYGPSLKNTWPEIVAERARGATVVSVSGGHDFLIGKGIVPDIHIDVDPREHKGFFTRTPHPQVKYWMASCCHPKVIDNLRGQDLTLWHIHNSETDLRILTEIDTGPDAFILGGGGSVGCRAVNVMYTQGFRSFSIHGMDCSFENDTGEQHAGDHSGKRQMEWIARCGDRWFRTSGTLVAIAKSFLENQSVLERRARHDGEPQVFAGDCIETLIHGDGLLAEMIRQGNADVEVISAVSDPDAVPAGVAA